MTIQFVTQVEYKDKKRDDLRETLDIQISDSSGLRDYEMYSGGEAFRVNLPFGWRFPKSFRSAKVPPANPRH